MQRTEKLAKIRFPSRPDQLKKVRDVVRNTVRRRGLEAELVDAMTLAVDEACSNVIKHAYGPAVTGEMVLEILSSENEIIFRLRDFADPVDADCIRPRTRDELKPGGLGLSLIHAVMDKVELVDSPVGNTLEMRKVVAPNENAER